MKRKLLICTLFLSAFFTAQAQWTTVTVNTTAQLDAIYFINDQTGFCGGGFTGIRKTVNGGATWVTVSSTLNARDFSFADLSNAYVASVVGTSMSKTTDVGANWTSITPPTSNSLWGVAAPNSTTAYFVGTGGVLWKTTNGGATVSVLNSGTTDQLTDVVFTSGTTGYILQQGGTIRKTTNSGASWTVVYSGSITFTEMDFVDANVGYAVGSGGKVLKTTDAGANWTLLTTNSTSYLQGVNFYDANNGLVVGTGGTILYTSDGGANWVSQPSGTTLTLYDVSMLTATSGVVVGASGKILRNTNLLSTSENQVTSSIQMMPNPVVDELIIDSVTGIKSIEIYDLLGNKLFSQSQMLMEESHSLNVDFLNDGTYLVSVQTADNNSIIKKIVKTTN